MTQKNLMIASLAVAGLAFGAAANAHVANIDLSYPVVSSAIEGITVTPAVAGRTVSLTLDGTASPDGISFPVGHAEPLFGGRGWRAGTDNVLGNSHELASGVFFTFTVSKTSEVTISVAGDAAAPGLDPAFSVYRNALVDEGHDDALADPLNPTTGFPPAPVASPTDAKAGTNPKYKPHDGFRDTKNFTQTAGAQFVGQFDALANWSLANEAGDWSLISFLTKVDSRHGSATETLSNYRVTAGTYTIAVGDGGNVVGPTFAGKVSVTVRQ
jgi:hypothetical protein